MLRIRGDRWLKETVFGAHTRQLHMWTRGTVMAWERPEQAKARLNSGQESTRQTWSPNPCWGAPIVWSLLGETE